MKKYFILFAAAILSAVACNKEELVDPNEKNGNGTEMSFKAYTETTKTTLGEEGDVIWSTNDAISVFDGTSNNKFTATGEGTVVTFTGSAETADTYYAVYPYSASASLSGSVISTTIPTAQTAVYYGYDPASVVAVGKSTSDSEIYFKNATALLAITPTVDVASITVETTNGAYLAGDVAITVNADHSISTAVTNGSTSVTLSGDIYSYSTYYVSVLPGNYQGLKLTFKDAAGNEVSKTNNTAISIERTTMVNFGTFKIHNSGLVRNYTLDGKEEVAAFLADATSTRESINNLTVTGGTVTSSQITGLKNRIEFINGTLCFDGIIDTTIEENADSWLETQQIFKSESGDGANGFTCRGSIIIENLNCSVNPNGFQTFTTIYGDLILKDTAFPFDWNAWDNLTTVTGDLTLDGILSALNNVSMSKLQKVGGTFTINNCLKSFWNISGIADEFEVGGDLVLTNNTKETFQYADWRTGFSKFASIGGNVVIFNNAIGNDVDEYCFVRDMVNDGVISENASVKLGNSSQDINFSLVPDCEGNLPVADLVIASKDDYTSLQSLSSKIDVKNLTITAADMSVSELNNVYNYINSISGTITIDGAADGDTGWMNTSNLFALSTGKSITLKNLDANIDIAGFKNFTEIDGDIVIENCPLTYLRDGRSDTDLATITNVTGDVILGGVFNDGLKNIFQALTHIGGDLIVRNVNNESYNVYVTMAALTTVDGDVDIENVTLNVFNHGTAMLAALTTVGGDVILNNISGSSVSSDNESNKAFTALKTVGGNFSMTNVAGIKRFYSGMDLNTIGGDLIIMNNAAFKSFSGFNNLSKIGGNVTVTGNSSAWVTTTTDDKNIGICAVKDLIETGAISASATVTLDVDLSTLTSCRASYTLNGYSEVQAFIDGDTAQAEVNNLTVTGSDVTCAQLYALKNKVSAVRGTLTLDGVATDEYADNSDLWMETEQIFGTSAMKLYGNLTVKNVPCNGNPNGIQQYTEFPGTLDLENNGTWFKLNDGWCFGSNVTRIKGSLILKNNSGYYANFNSSSLTNIDGDLIISGTNNGLWNFGGLSNNLYIAGNLDVSGSPLGEGDNYHDSLAKLYVKGRISMVNQWGGNDSSYVSVWR